MRANLPIKFARLSSGMTQAELGAACGKYAKFIQRIERGGPVSISPEVAKKLSAALNVPENILLEVSE
jgi:Helix-turn-helix.